MGENGLALDNNCNVGYPHADCEPHDKLIFVPDGESGAHNERFGCEKRIGLERWKDTYIRKTINTEAAARPT
jgi:hypothetical protein